MILIIIIVTKKKKIEYYLQELFFSQNNNWHVFVKQLRPFLSNLIKLDFIDLVKFLKNWWALNEIYLYSIFFLKFILLYNENHK